MSHRIENVEDRRTSPRFQAREGAFVNASSNFGKIVNISLGGMAFNYINWDKDTSAEGTMDIYLNGQDILTNLPFQVLSENDIQDSSFSSLVTMKRCRVRFKDLNEEQTGKLEHFILHHTAGQA